VYLEAAPASVEKLIVPMNSLKAFWQFCKGKKTYFISFAACVYGWGVAENLWPHTRVSLIPFMRHSCAPRPGAHSTTVTFAVATAEKS